MNSCFKGGVKCQVITADVVEQQMTHTLMIPYQQIGGGEGKSRGVLYYLVARSGYILMKMQRFSFDFISTQCYFSYSY